MKISQRDKPNAAARLQDRRPGFSLIELMIAIVILGIGLTMVATLFPIAIQQTEKAVEVSMAPAVAEYAAGILKLKLKTWNDYEATHPVPGGVWPGARGVIESVGVQPGDNGGQPQALVEDPTLGAPQERVRALEQSDWPNDPWVNEPYPLFFPVPCDNLFRTPIPGTDRLTNYIVPGTGLIVTENRFSPDNDQDIAYNAAIAWKAIVDGVVTAQTPTDMHPFPEFIRTKITVFDRVYPPPKFSRFNGVTMYPGPNLATLGGGAPNAAMENKYFNDAGQRRYVWKAFVARTDEGAAATAGNATTGEPADAGTRVFDVRIVVLRRANAGQKFAAQHNPFVTNPLTDLYTTAPGGLCNPITRVAPPTPTDRDTLFPQPWLVIFDTNGNSTSVEANYARGELLCYNPPPGDGSPGIARLLPPGAQIVNFRTGQVHRVLSRTYSADGIPDVIRIAPDPNVPLNDDRFGANSPGLEFGAEMAWIFPPAIDTASNSFVDESPVVAVISTTITVE